MKNKRYPLFITGLLLINLFVKLNPIQAQTWGNVGGGCYVGNVFDSYTDSENNRVYFGGFFDSCDDNYPTRGFVYWNGSQWTDVSGDYGNDYTTSIVKWNDSVYHSVMSGSFFVGVQTKDNKIGSFDAAIRAMCVYHGDLYVGGQFSMITSTPNKGLMVNGIARWDGKHWHTLGTGIKVTKQESAPHLNGSAPCVYAMYVWNDTLYLGGRFDSANNQTAHNLAKWDGTTLTAIASGVTSSSGISVVKSLYSYNGLLLIGGLFNQAGKSVAVQNFATYNGKSKWGHLNTNFDNEVDCFSLFQGLLYAGGYFQNIGKCVASYDGNVWSSMEGGITNGNRVLALSPFDNTLIVGGQFTQVGSIRVQNIASWTPASFRENYSFNTSSCHVFPNPAHDDMHLVFDENFHPSGITILNEVGDIVKVLNPAADSKENLFSIDVSSLPAGLYLVRAVDGDKIVSTVFHKE